ncbi:MAG: keto-deoxy-phosphogluconate aldolase, partial [Proteobacteria bacterium]|nr:keto-deoxy-phosphogluconate aldolase [Pseudomonadota bacterium]
MSFAGVEACFSGHRVLPVITPHSLESGLTVARLLFEAGLRMQEITLRTAAALPTIAALGRELPQLIVGAGTVLNAQQGEAAIAAGAR